MEILFKLSKLFLPPTLNSKNSYYYIKERVNLLNIIKCRLEILNIFFMIVMPQVDYQSNKRYVALAYYYVSIIEINKY